MFDRESGGDLIFLPQTEKNQGNGVKKPTNEPTAPLERTDGVTIYSVNFSLKGQLKNNLPGKDRSR